MQSGWSGKEFGETVCTDKSVSHVRTFAFKISHKILQLPHAEAMQVYVSCISGIVHTELASQRADLPEEHKRVDPAAGMLVISNLFIT